jgi:trk system potassium uptake protein TrkH
MLSRILALPLFVFLMGVSALAMYVPAIYAASSRDWEVARAYSHSATILLVFFIMVGIAMAAHKTRNQARSHLLALLSAFTLLPLMLAVPLYESVGNTSFLNTYFEMVSSLTTTGATVFDDPGRLADADHLWRALVGWMGGFLMWVVAIAIFAPLNLGGFEVLSPANLNNDSGVSQITQVADPAVRLQRYAVTLAPIYAGLTLVLWIALSMLGDRPLVAISHAMSTMATSGISPVGGIEGAKSGLAGEAVIFLFLGFALSRQTFAGNPSDRGRARLLRDPEIQMGLVCILGLTVLLFLRHWAGALEVASTASLRTTMTALWGSIFTVLSFLSTTGFESAGWTASRAWSGLDTPGLLLLGLALTGGGVATTAGGVKLLRVYALYKHGRRELVRLVIPSSVGGSGSQARFVRRQGAYIAWIFFMLFAMSLAVIMLALSLTGLDFEQTVVLSVAAISTTGPLASVAGEVPISYATLSDAAKLILAASMVLGRLETLAIIALLNPEFWRS